VFFVHNAVESIERRAAELRALVPEADIRVGHGQMRERDLERLMLDFYHRRFNVLVCTTIIESGIDVPTANTMIIDRADRFGLAQLHQLRGRVGRSHHRAFAYLLAPPKAALSGDAVKRLEAIESLEDLGAGFALATHDLEIRGAGELLGDEQSGQITEIGFSLYLELLGRAVAALRAGREPELDKPLHAGPELDLHIPALIPADYMPDVHLRLVLYKRIAAAPDDAAIDDLEVELIDRFGALAPATQNLFRITRLKLRAASLGLTRLDVGPLGGLVDFGAEHTVDPKIVLRLVQKEPKTYRLEGATRLRFTRRGDTDAARLATAAALLTALGAS
jgi:transcription-repair coupling factor (superfamily II helicase)